ncbi:hypothetical protein Ac2012v2_000075 [Leucoagaricus gongylophorus]
MAASSPCLLTESLSSSRSTTSPGNDGRVVRFDNECVLIPEYSSQRIPRVVTKSYSLPLWKRRGVGAAAVSELDAIHDLSSSSFEGTHVVIRIPIPKFIRRISPSRNASDRSLSLSPTTPLSPCLVQRTPSCPASEPRYLPSQQPLNRRLPQPNNQWRQDGQTVPLRACCPDCFPTTEQCLKEGSTWQENFTKGARRRRRASLDSSAVIDAVLVAGDTSGSCDARVMPSTSALTVDEVDKHRRSQKFATADVVDSDSDIEGARSGLSLDCSIPFSKYDQDHDTASLLSDSPPLDLSQPHLQSYLIPLRNASPIAEEDESELFPLPSLCRSTGLSPRQSPRNSPWTSLGVSPKVSPRSSPNVSRSCLYPNNATEPAAGFFKTMSTENVNSEEVMLSDGTSRTSGNITTPLQLGVSASPTSKQEPPSFAMILPTMSKLSVNSGTVPSSNNNNGVDAILISATSSNPAPNLSLSPVTAVSVTPKSLVTSSSPKTGRKLSFGFPFLKAGEVIKDASADALRGVSSMSSGGGLRIGSI